MNKAFFNRNWFPSTSPSCNFTCYSMITSDASLQIHSPSISQWQFIVIRDATVEWHQNDQRFTNSLHENVNGSDENITLKVTFACLFLVDNQHTTNDFIEMKPNVVNCYRIGDRSHCWFVFDKDMNLLKRCSCHIFECWKYTNIRN